MKNIFSGSVILAIFLAIGLGIWMATGEISQGGQSDSGNSAETIVVREAKKDTELFKVRYLTVKSDIRQQEITIRGRTKANAIVTVRSETAGVLEQRLVSKGQKVKAGDLVCVLDKGTREASFSEAKARLAQADTDYKSGLRLKKKGFTAKNRLTQLKANVDGAKANYAAAKLELSRINIKANASGIVQDPIAEVGDTLSLGSACITLIDIDPMLFTGQVPELLIGNFFIGMEASVKLVTGITTTGKVRYIAAAADASTRTYQIEIELADTPNAREGMTAETKILLRGNKAFLVSPAWISLSDEGRVGVRTLDANDIVHFTPIKIATQGKDGFWVTGLKENARIITLGQDYVKPGRKVEPHMDMRGQNFGINLDKISGAKK